MADSSYLMFVGSYTDFDILAHLPNNDKVGKGVYCFHFKNGEITPLTTIPSNNPAVLSFHPTIRNTMYVLEEGIKHNGTISKVDFHCMEDKVGSLKLDIVSNDTSHIQTKGKSTCYFKVDPQTEKYGIAINYWEGSADLFSMDAKDKSSIEKPVQHLDHMALAKQLQTPSEAESNPRRMVANREDHWGHRQVGPHAHSVHYYKDWVFIPDLGENCIFQYAWNPESEDIISFESQIKLKPGAGPRHMVFHPRMKVAYVSNELSSSITVLAIDDAEPHKLKCRMKVIQDIDTDQDMAVDEDIYKRNYVAEIGMSNDGKFIYCSNRGYDTIAVFKILEDDGGKLENVSFVPTFGKTPRHFMITPDDRYLVGANQDSNNLVVFQRDLEKGTLDLVQKYDGSHFGECGMEFAAPNFVLFAPKEAIEEQDDGKVMLKDGNQVVGSPFLWALMGLICAVLFGICIVM